MRHLWIKVRNYLIAPLFIVVDLFCGFGGTTLGYEKTNGKIITIAAVNHDHKAIQSHHLNNLEVHHFNEDIRTLDLTRLILLVKAYKAKYPNAKLILWASLECTNFSKAKGGLPRDADSRTLAEHLYRYIEGLDPDYIKIENVVEFMSWGPLDEKGKPISKKNGLHFVHWCNHIKSYGYKNEWKELNSANFGAYTSRNRLFGCFAKKGLPIVWPNPTHSKKPDTTTLFGNSALLKWKAVKDVLSLDIEGESIFNRKKDLSPKTYERVYAGLIKFVAGGKDAFIAKYYSGRPESKVIGLDGPAGTIRTSDCQSLVQANFMLKYNSNKVNGEVFAGHGLDKPAPVISTQGRLGIVHPKFICMNYSNGSQHSTLDKPCPTISTKDRFSIVSNQFINRDFTNGGESHSIDAPAGSVMPNPKMNLVTSKPFIMPTSYDNKPRSIDEPSPVITANRKHHYIVNPSHGGHSTSSEAPCPVIIARQDKAPLYLVSAISGQYNIPIYETDCEVMVKIKEFMAFYNIVDIKMRMLMVPELLCIQGFPKQYKMVGNQTDAKKFIGNSVVPHVVTAWGLELAKAI
jgi:DNA (cytosine-5)-methyltransferase 1